MKKLIGLGTIIASIAPLTLVVACNNNSHKNNIDKNTQNKYQALAVGVELRNLSDEDLWVWSSVLPDGGVKDLVYKYAKNPDINEFRDQVSSHIKGSGEFEYPIVTQKEYDDILKFGKDILVMKNTRYAPGFNYGVVKENMNYYYNHYKNSSIKSKIDTNDFDSFNNEDFTLKWL